MHELAIMESVLEVVLDYSTKNRAVKVHQINLAVGGLSDIVSAWAERYFTVLSQGTIAENARIKIERIPVRIKCRACGTETVFDREEPRFYCPRCQSGRVQVMSGREFKITSIEVT